MWILRNSRYVYNCDIALASNSLKQNTLINPCTIWNAACYNRVNGSLLDLNYQLSYCYCIIIITIIIINIIIINIIIINIIIRSCLEKLITKKERQMKLTRFIFPRRFEVIVTPLSSDKYLQVLEFK